MFSSFAPCRALVGLVLVLSTTTAATAKTWVLQDDATQVEFDDATGLMAVTQRTTQQRWQQRPAGTAFTVDHVTADPGRLVVALTGPFAMEMTLTLSTASDLEVTLTADPATPLAEPLAFPGPFTTPAADWNLVFPEAEGMLIPIEQVDTVLRGREPISVYDMSGLLMPWIGVTDRSLKSGYMMILDTAFDVSVSLNGRGGAPAPQPLWEAELGRFGYARRLRYHFFAAGGYVAQAKHYRDYVQRTREFSTLRERALTRPAIDKLVGAVHIYTWDDGRTLELAQAMKAAGIDRAWVGWDPNHPSYPKPGYSQGLTELGFLAGVYDLYRDIYSDTEYAERTAERPELKDLWLHRYDYHGLFEDLVARNADNTPMAMVRSSDVNLMRYWVCTAAMLPHVPDRITKELAVYPHESVFLDVTLAAGPIECFSPLHPMTHRQDAAARVEIHRYMAEDLGLVVGSEAGADYGAAHTEFMHGLVSMHKYFGDRRGPGGRRDDSSPTYRGDWSDTACPSMMLGEHEPTDIYWQIGLNPAYRVPLYELVYHDATVTSWRWNDNSHKQPTTWARKDLFNALYANAPQWNLDQATWDRLRDQFVASFKTLNPVLRAVGYDEMTDHRFLNADRSLQETCFSSGARILVNFSSTAINHDGVTVPAAGFVMLPPSP